MIDLFGGRRTDPAAAARVKAWAADVFGLTDRDTVVVSELRCSDPDCPDVETVVAVLGAPGRARRHVVLKPLAAVTRADLADLAARGIHG